MTLHMSEGVDASSGLPELAPRTPLKVRSAIDALMLSLVFGAKTLYSFTEECEALEADNYFDTLHYRASMRSNGHLLLNIKLYTYHLVCNGLPATKPEAFGITREEARRVRMALSVDSKLRTHLKNLHRAGYKTFTLKGFNALLAKVFDPKRDHFNTWAAKFTGKKMAFLIRSFNLPQQELIDEIIVAAHYAILKAYPRYDSALHLLNVGKSGASSRGNNIIKEMTTKKRAVLVRDEHDPSKFVSLKASLSSFGTGEAGESESTILARSSVMVSLLDDPKEVFETQHSFHTLESRLNERQRKLVSILRGVFDADFTKFLQENNSDFAERATFNLLLSKAAAYLKIDVRRAENFVLALKPHLS